jgi:hypothetical protein
MRRVAMFLEEEQIETLKLLAEKQQLPWAAVARHAINFYVKALRVGGSSLLREKPKSARKKR